VPGGGWGSLDANVDDAIEREMFEVRRVIVDNG
jgi:hypothetical protein